MVVTALCGSLFTQAPILVLIYEFNYICPVRKRQLANKEIGPDITDGK